MSHFAVLVIGENIAEKLEPYWELDLPLEELKTDPRAVFKVEIDDTLESLSEYLSGERTYWIGRVRQMENLLCNSENMSLGEIDDYRDYLQKYSERLKAVERAIENPARAPAFILETKGYAYVPGKGYWYYHNPNAKWDRWTLGGLFHGCLLLKEDKESLIGVDSAPVERIDWDRMDSIRREAALRMWDITKEAFSPNPSDRLNGGHIDKEGFLSENSEFSTSAVITEDGEWNNYRRAWFLRSFREAFINDLPDGTTISIVDCHI